MRPRKALDEVLDRTLSSGQLSTYPPTGRAKSVRILIRKTLT